MSETRVIVIGMGSIGFGVASAVAAQQGMTLAAMVDPADAKVGQTLSQLAGGTDPGAGPAVVAELDDAVIDLADVAVVCTSSKFDVITPMLIRLLEGGTHVVSTCEQMTWPRYRHADLADKVDAAAQAAGKVALGSGVNPGFVMDTLAVTLTTLVRRVQAVRCVRRVEASVRREALQAKIGATMTPGRFQELKARGAIGHAGLCESAALLVAGLGREAAPGSVEEMLEPVIADRHFNSSRGPIEPGFVAGIRNRAVWRGEGLEVELDLTMAVGVEDPHDRIQIEGPVQLELRLPGAVPGDSATVAVMLNLIPVLGKVEPGLRTMLDMPVAGCRGRDG